MFKEKVNAQKDGRTTDNGLWHKLAGLRPVELKIKCIFIPFSFKPQSIPHWLGRIYRFSILFSNKGCFLHSLGYLSLTVCYPYSVEGYQTIFYLSFSNLYNGQRYPSAPAILLPQDPIAQLVDNSTEKLEVVGWIPGLVNLIIHGRNYLIFKILFIAID